MKIELNKNQAAMISEIKEDGSVEFKIVYNEDYDEYLPLNIQMLFGISESLENSEEFMAIITKSINSLFKEPTTH